jgi:hypothetical protein
MSRSVRLALLSLTLLMALFPLAAGLPGQPPSLKADEPAYLLMALSLAEDGDVLCEPEDIQRGFDHFPYLPIDNLILMTTDGWETVYFGKPYIYSLLAAPFAALLGPNGFVTFNMLLLMAMVWMGATYLRRFNPDAVAALFAAAFFLLSSAFVYAFWIHPEILNLFSIAACLYLAFHEPETGQAPGRLRAALASSRIRPALSAAVLSLAVYNKPMLALLGVPALWIAFSRRRLAGATTFVAGALLATGLLAGGSSALTGKPTAYLGSTRSGLKVLSSESYRESVRSLRDLRAVHKGAPANSWDWMFRVPTPAPGEVAQNVRYFLVGRHTGLVPYLPMAVLALLLFLIHSRGSPERWLVVGSLVATALSFILWIPWNWHGGGGFIGNRYFVNAYPAFLFLVTAIRPVWLVPTGIGAASVMLGSLLSTPWGASVPQPTMQSHVRGGLFRYFPFEISMRRKIPGYDISGFLGVGILGRSDVFHLADEPNGVMWVRGATETELWFFSEEPMPKLILDVVTWAPDNRIVLAAGDSREVLTFEGAAGSPANTRRVELVLGEPTHRAARPTGPQYFYRLLVASRTGRHEHGNMMNVGVQPLFYIGAELHFIGSGDPRQVLDANRIAWEECSPPERAAVGEIVELPVRVRNTGNSTWGMRGARQVNLVYRWLDESGGRLDAPRGNETLYRDVRPGEEISKLMRVRTPPTAGRYRLVLDAARRHVSLFSSRGGSTCEGWVEVGPPVEPASRPAAGPSAGSGAGESR